MRPLSAQCALSDKRHKHCPGQALSRAVLVDCKCVCHRPVGWKELIRR